MSSHLQAAILEEIRSIRAKSKRPGADIIINAISERSGLNVADVRKEFEFLVNSGSIINRPTVRGKDSYFIVELFEPEFALNSSVSESEDELSLGLGKEQEDCDNPAANPNQRPRRDDRTDFMVYLDTVGRLTDQIDKLNESLSHERDRNDLLREDNFQLRLENFTLKQQLQPPSSSSSLGTGMEKSTNDIIEIRTELISKAENHKKTPVNETIASDNNPLSHNTSKETKEQNENKESGTAEVNKPMAGKAKQNRRRKARKGKSQPGNERRAENEGESDESEKIKVLIVGDSELQRVDASKLSNEQRDVEIKYTRGVKINQAAQKTGKSNNDVIIVHVGTNNLNTSTPEQICKETIDMLDQIQKNNPKSRIAFSSIFKRKDNMSLNAKAMKVNNLLAEELAINGLDMIDNSNVTFSNLWKDGLHISDGGARKFSGNVSKFIKYC